MPSSSASTASSTVGSSSATAASSPLQAFNFRKTKTIPQRMIEVPVVAPSTTDIVTSSSSTKAASPRRAFNFLKKKRTPHKMIIEGPVAAPSTTTTETVSTTIWEELAELQFVDDNISDLDETPILSEIDNNGKQHGFETFVENFVNEMSTRNTRREKRKNVVNLFTSAIVTFKMTIHESYMQFLFDGPNVDCDELEIHLRASSHILQQFFNVQQRINEMNQYLPANLQDEGYPTPQAFVFGLVESHIFAHLSLHYTYMNEVTPRQAATMMAWIETYLSEMERQCPDVTPSPAWRSDNARLGNHYVSKGVHRELRELILRSIELWSDDDIRKNAAGELVSGHPEEIAFMVDSQLAVAKKHLPDSHTEAVVVACNEEISTMVTDLMLHVGTNWKTLSTPCFCSIINDASRLSDMIEARNEEYLSSLEHRASGEMAVQDLAELSVHVNNILCERIVFSLREPEAILSSIGSPAWEADKKGTAISRTTATFRDYFTDLESWLSTSYFFPKVLNKCFDLTLRTYVESFFSNTMAHGIKDAAIVAENLSQDFLNLFIFFNGSAFEKYMGKAGFLSAAEIKSRLEVIQSMSRLTNPSISPSELKEDAIRVLSQTTQDGDRNSAVLHISGLRVRHGSEKSIDWLKMIAHAEIALKQSVAGRQRQDMIKLPDLRNSRYIHKMRINKKELRRSISDRSLPSAEAMKQMIQVQPQRKIRNFIASKWTVPVFIASKWTVPNFNLPTTASTGT